ncbi:MAG: hypothetical protein JW932_10565 [Deltaproteobacteria bacterium]|nr:hypothetical protein [Deltaproteobacteria bacterium]
MEFLFITAQAGLMTPTAQAAAAVGSLKCEKLPVVKRVFLRLRHRLEGIYERRIPSWNISLRSPPFGLGWLLSLLLSPFYFLRAGTFVSLPALISTLVVFLLLLGGKVISKIFGLYPIIGQFRRKKDERWYYTLMMSTGLTFGTISALYGFSHNIVTQEQYSFLVAVVITSAVVPTLIAGLFFLPRHLLPKAEKATESLPAENGLSDEG